MISLLREIIMPDETPTGDKAVYVFIEMIALGFVLYAIEEAFKDHPSWLKVVLAVVLGLLFFWVGVNWTQLKGRVSLGLARRVDGVANDYRYRYGLALLLVAAFGVYTIVSLRSLRSDLDGYVTPRTLSTEQTRDLEAFLAKHQQFPVTVKVAVHDTEALEYANQILFSFKRANWDDAMLRITEHPDSEPPFTLGDGLFIGVVGDNGRPLDPKHNPAQLLQDAFSAAHIDIAGGSTISAGEYKLFVLVGHRPLKLGNQQPLLSRIGRWMERLSQ
jgi:hypothetical protein